MDINNNFSSIYIEQIANQYLGKSKNLPTNDQGKNVSFDDILKQKHRIKRTKCSVKNICSDAVFYIKSYLKNCLLQQARQPTLPIKDHTQKYLKRCFQLLRF